MMSKGADKPAVKYAWEKWTVSGQHWRTLVEGGGQWEIKWQRRVLVSFWLFQKVRRGVWTVLRGSHEVLGKRVRLK